MPLDDTTWQPYRLARSELDVREWTEPGKSNPVVDGYFAEVGHPQYDDDTAWCAAFVGAMLERAGYQSTRRLNARSYMGWGIPVQKPQVGDIVVFWRISPDDWRGHVGFYAGETDLYVQVLGGNQRNAVSIQNYPKAQLLGYRRASAAPQRESAPAESTQIDVYLEKLKVSEGGYVNHPADRGGPTKYGITLGTLQRWRTDNSLKAKDVRDLTWSEAKSIYRAYYWDTVRATEMPKGIDYMMFDMAVNHGPRGAARILQRALGVTPDGIIGPITMTAAKQQVPQFLAQSIRDERARFFQDIVRRRPSQEVFLEGWLKRNERVLTDAVAFMAPHAARPARKSLWQRIFGG